MATGRPHSVRAGGAPGGLAGLRAHGAVREVRVWSPNARSRASTPTAFAVLRPGVVTVGTTSAMAFALATSLADDIHNLATVGLMGWPRRRVVRVNDNRHWLPDVAAGALGDHVAKLASAGGRIFGVKAPSILAAPTGMGLGVVGASSERTLDPSSPSSIPSARAVLPPNVRSAPQSDYLRVPRLDDHR